jgi:hypothetical protein
MSATLTLTHKAERSGRRSVAARRCQWSNGSARFGGGFYYSVESEQTRIEDTSRGLDVITVQVRNGRNV